MTRKPKTPLLDKVKVPADLRRLPESDLPQLAEELRAELIDARNPLSCSCKWLHLDDGQQPRARCRSSNRTFRLRSVAVGVDPFTKKIPIHAVLLRNLRYRGTPTQAHLHQRTLALLAVDRPAIALVTDHQPMQYL